MSTGTPSTCCALFPWGICLQRTYKNTDGCDCCLDVFILSPRRPEGVGVGGFTFLTPSEGVDIILSRTLFTTDLRGSLLSHRQSRNRWGSRSVDRRILIQPNRTLPPCRHHRARHPYAPFGTVRTPRRSAALDNSIGPFGHSARTHNVLQIQ